MGRKKKGRPVNGVLLLDKPLGMSSNFALQKVKRIFYARKAGHTGSLDPLATGMLPICLGEATKISAFLLDADKTYMFSCQLGAKTETADAEGDITERAPFEHIQQADIEKVLPDFMGEQEQVPPMYSALKKDGKRLYELAREGKTVERKARRICIYDLQLLSFENGILSLQVTCSKGTYVRTLAEDIAKAVGTLAYVTELRRSSVGPYESDMITMQQLEDMADADYADMDKLLLEMDSGIESWPAVNLDADSAYYVKLGQPIQVAKAPTDGLVRIYDGEQFIGVGEIDNDGRVAPRRMMNL